MTEYLCVQSTLLFYRSRCHRRLSHLLCQGDAGETLGENRYPHECSGPNTYVIQRENVEAWSRNIRHLDWGGCKVAFEER